MIAIILVNYNGAKDTIECLISLSECSYKNVAIIVVDNCSTDDSIPKLLSVQKQFGFVLLKSSENKGFSAGNNIGIRYALNSDADYVLLLNNDTLVEPDFLEKLINGFEGNSKCGATIGKIYYENERDTIWYAGGSLNLRTARIEHWGYREKDKVSKSHPQKVTFATGCCLCLSRSLIETIGLLDEKYFLYEEDVEYCLRILQAGYEIIYIPDAIIYHKVSSSTGATSAKTQFYTMRNKYLLIQHHFKGLNKICAYIYSTAQMLYRCLKGESRFCYYFAALKAFTHHETGNAGADKII